MLDKHSLAELADIYKEKYNRLLKDNVELERQIDENNSEIEQLRKERDEARRMLCEDWAKQDGLPLDWQGRRGAEGMAEFVGWDCFKDNP